jgi:hypothetical protein
VPAAAKATDVVATFHGMRPEGGSMKRTGAQGTHTVITCSKACSNHVGADRAESLPAAQSIAVSFIIIVMYHCMLAPSEMVTAPKRRCFSLYKDHILISSFSSHHAQSRYRSQQAPLAAPQQQDPLPPAAPQATAAV